MMKTNRALYSFAFIIFAIVTNPANAAVIKYNDEATFLAVIGGSADISEDFNSFNTDKSFRNSSFDVGPFTLSSDGADQNLSTQNQIDAPPFSFGDFANIDDSTFAHFFIASGDTTATITFDNDITAFGALFKELSSSTSLVINTSDGIETVTQSIGQGVAFFGFVLDGGTTMNSLTFSTAVSGDGFGIDDVLLKTSSQVNVASPSSLMFILLIGFGLVFRKLRA